MKNKLSIFLLFKKKGLSVKLFNFLDKNVLFEFEIPLLEIVPKLVELIVSKLNENNLDLSSLDSIYLAQRESTWNGNRLVVAFVKTLAFSLPINIYKRDLGNSEELDFYSEINFLDSFQEIDWRELKPLYNKCQITNI